MGDAIIDFSGTTRSCSSLMRTLLENYDTLRDAIGTADGTTFELSDVMFEAPIFRPGTCICHHKEAFEAWHT